ncbi:MAG: trypsin-like peptidase domain-containing protein [Anaerolineae bacterium]|nr:MAG: trypsin-like peptidase domain-containing protein [Anaerolineae bacterium]
MAQVLQNLSDALAATVETTGRSVVRVEARRRLPATGIVWSSAGVIVTAHHVVSEEENIHLGLPDGRTVPADLVGRDPTTDLAVLRAQATDLTSPAWADPENLRVGHLVLALGRPGKTVQATLGIVSALGEGWRTPAGGQVDRYLQTDVVMYPGFSGGPLVGVTGQVMGLNTSALLRGVSLAVPVPTLRRVVETLLAHGRVRRGYLGIGIQPVRLPEALAREVSQETGLLLVQVRSGGPGEQGGLLLGDIIVALDGQPIRHHDDLLAQLSGDRVGNAVPLRIVRAGQVQEVTVTIGEHP